MPKPPFNAMTSTNASLQGAPMNPYKLASPGQGLDWLNRAICIYLLLPLLVACVIYLVLEKRAKALRRQTQMRQLNPH